LYQRVGIKCDKYVTEHCGILKKLFTEDIVLAVGAMQATPCINKDAFVSTFLHVCCKELSCSSKQKLLSLYNSFCYAFMPMMKRAFDFKNTL